MCEPIREPSGSVGVVGRWRLGPRRHVQFRLPIGLRVWPLIVFPHTRADKPEGFMATVLQPMSPSAVRLCF
jgi:hypothetical protein